MKQTQILAGVLIFTILLLGCAPIGKVGDVLQVQTEETPLPPVPLEGTSGQASTSSAQGHNEPPGGKEKYLDAGKKITLSPDTVTLSVHETKTSIVVNATGSFVFKNIYLCKAPCISVDDWVLAGTFNGPLFGNYIRAHQTLSQPVSLQKTELVSGNNFIAVNICNGVGDCGKAKKWTIANFSVVFKPECEKDSECTIAGKTKCDLAAKRCVACLDNNNCAQGQRCVNRNCVTTCDSDSVCVLGSVMPCGCFHVKDRKEQENLLPPPQLSCDYAAGTACICDSVCKQTIQSVEEEKCKGKSDGTACGEIRVCKSEQCVLPSVSECSGKIDGTFCSKGACYGELCTTFVKLPLSIGKFAQVMQLLTSESTTIVVDSTNGFTAGDSVLIHQTRVASIEQESLAGRYETNTIASMTATSMTMQKPLLYAYATQGNARAQVVLVQEYEQLIATSGGMLTTVAWDGNKGGIFAVNAKSIGIESSAKIDMLGKGFFGGNNGGCHQNQQGESYAGGLSVTTAPFGGAGGGGYHIDYKASSSGGGGGHKSAGENGRQDSQSGPAGKAGNTYGDADLSRINLGSGGGGGGGECSGGGTGGNGGGAIMLFADKVTISGQLDARGSVGGNAINAHAAANEAAGGGGGSGGSVLIVSPSVTAPLLMNKILVAGGAGGAGEAWNVGGAGGTGRLFIKK